MSLRGFAGTFGSFVFVGCLCDGVCNIKDMWSSVACVSRMLSVRVGGGVTVAGRELAECLVRVRYTLHQDNVHGSNI